MMFEERWAQTAYLCQWCDGAGEIEEGINQDYFGNWNTRTWRCYECESGALGFADVLPDLLPPMLPCQGLLTCTTFLAIDGVCQDCRAAAEDSMNDARMELVA